MPIFYEPYKGQGGDELVIRVLHEETFYETEIKKCNHSSKLMPFDEIMLFLQKKIPNAQTTVDVHVVVGEGKETLECVMDLKFYLVKDNPIIETQKLMFQRYKTENECGYEKEIKRQKVENEQLISENVRAGGEISKQRELNVELEKQRNALELKCFQLEQRLKECDAETRGLITMNEELRRFKESIVAVVEGRNGMNGVEISRQYGGDCPFDDIGSMKSFNPDSHSAMFGL